MYCLYTGKCKITEENITFYLLKSVQNINNSASNLIIVYHLVGHNLQGFRFFQDWLAEVTHEAKHDGSFSEMIGPSISN